MLTAGQDYLYLPKISFTVDLAGTKVVHGCLVGTKSMVFLFPSSATDARGFTLTVSRFSFGGEDVRKALAELFADPNLTVEELESTCAAMLAEVEGQRVFKISELVRFQIQTSWVAIFTAAMVIQAPGGPPKGVAIKGGDMRKAAKAFFSGLER